MAKYSDIVNGLKLFMDKSTPGENFPGVAHDVLFGGSLSLKISMDDRVQLEGWGWFKSREFDCWAHWV